MLGHERVEWTVEACLLARAVYLLAGANWQRSGGKGPKPKPVKVPDGKPRPSPEDVARRLRNLGLLPGGKPSPDRPLNPLEQRIGQQLERAQAAKAAARQPTRP